MSEFIFMLTHHDQTVENALEVFERIKDAGVRYVGFKDIGADERTLAKLTDAIHANGQCAALEIVSQSEETEIASARIGLRLGVDYLLGGRHVNRVCDILGASSVKYLPFCGETRGHPTQLTGTIEEIVADAERLCANARVDGVDLLAYRFNGYVEALIKRVCSAVERPVVVAGTIDCYERIAVVERYDAWGFTIGSAIFEERFRPDTFHSQAVEILRRLELRRALLATPKSDGRSDRGSAALS